MWVGFEPSTDCRRWDSQFGPKPDFPVNSYLAYKPATRLPDTCRVVSRVSWIVFKGGKRNVLTLSSGIYNESNTIAVRISYVHLTVAPRLICGTQVDSNTFVYKLTVQRVDIVYQ